MLNLHIFQLGMHIPPSPFLKEILGPSLLQDTNYIPYEG